MFNEPSKFVRLFLLAVAACICAQPVSAQRARFPDAVQVQSTTPPPMGQTIITSPGAPTTSPPVFTPPPTVLAPSTSPTQPFTQSAPTFGSPTFTPTQPPSQPFPVFPQAGPPTAQPPGQFDPITYAAPPPNQYQGTGSTWLPNSDWDQSWNSFRNDFLPRLIERPRARYTFIPGSGASELGINDLEIATTANIGNFLGSQQPLRISPGFIFHWWNGPDTTLNPGFDLPAGAYSAYLQFDHLTNPANPAGLETNLAIGYYGDFQNTSSYALRVTGRALGWFRINPYTIGKLGVEYFNRVDTKLLPAFGVYMSPNTDIKFDLFFPRSKLAHRAYNFSNSEAWVYIGAEYGGGSWAIQRIGGMNDQADINDVRAFIGVDWLGPRLVSGFFEFGYVFSRQIVYRSTTADPLDLKDSIMLRCGLAF